MEEGKLICASCQRDNTDTLAAVFCLHCSETLCDQCDKHHKRNKASSGHTTQRLGDKKEMEAYDTIKQLTQCAVHVEKKIKYLCKDHDKLCCNECAIVRHRKCDNIVSLAEEIEHANQEDLNATEDILKELTKHAKSLLLNEQSEKMKVDKTKEACTQALETLKKNMETAYKTLENKVTEDAGKGRDVITNSIIAQKNAIQKYKEELNKSIQKLETVKRVGQDIHIYIKEREMHPELKRLKQQLKDLRGKANSKELVIKETSSTKALQTCLKKFVDVDVNTSNVSLPIRDIKGIREPRAVKILEYTLKLDKETVDIEKLYYEFKTSQTRNKQVYGCAWLDSFLVLQRDTDVVLIDITGKPDLIQTNPHDENQLIITKIDGSSVAIASGDRYNRYFNLFLYQLDASRGVLVRLRKISTVQRNISGLAYDAGIKSLVVLLDSGLIQFMGLDGKVIESFQLQNVQQLLKSADRRKRYTLFDSNSKILYLTDSSTLIATTMEGCTVFEYKLPESVLGYPALDTEGNFYLPFGEKGQSVIQIVSPKGKLIRSIEICACAVNFMAVCFNTTMDKLAVLCDEKDKELKIFSIVP